VAAGDGGLSPARLTGDVVLRVGCSIGRGFPGRNVRRHKRLQDDGFTSSHQVLSSTCRSCRHIMVEGTLAWTALELWSSLVALGDCSDMDLRLCV
jgi:hypothetical protein